ncbi:beta-ketoacyl-[acyl-carrier-protein] synthase family protein [Candidatus Haliotispira prima]|uniref:Beta-ketoacyl-[acyl-carrier-protein] synthase family protein n=1 Tax=Candidatus Haliotispira prima TaxID=3034016 RepID=A0ABY8MHY5_9SPIO|nr:beta-ketoacyl-[acyl-carrier-protein] synthase family protein [Candidatus Haliotispira prima]
MTDRRIVITGIGTINPVGRDVPDFWENLAKGKSGIVNLCSIYPILSDYSVKIGGYFHLPENARDYFGRYGKWLKRLDEFIAYMQIAGAQAMQDSGLDMAKEDPFRVGSLLGSGEGGLNSHERNQSYLQNQGVSAISPLYVLNVIPNSGTGFFAQSYGLRGPNFAPVSACATSNHSIGLSCMMIETGMADVMFAGGSEASLNPSGIGAFGNLGALTIQYSDQPELASRPFDAKRSGFVMSNGAGAMCLEELEHAKKRGAKIYAEVSGYSFSADAHDLVAPHPEGISTSYTMKKAMEKARLAPSQISLINAHGTSTTLGDLAESIAIHKAFGPSAESVAVHSTKSMTGHTIGASGAIEAIAALLSMEKGIVHPSINCDEQDPEIRLNIVKETREDLAIEHIMSNNFGFGGQNAVVILSRFQS